MGKDTCEEKEGKKRKTSAAHKKSRKISNIVKLIFIILVVFCVVFVVDKYINKPEKEIITEASLMKIIDVSELSTYEAIYNGVAEVKDAKGKTEYYVSYEATVKAGIDFDKVDLMLNKSEKKIVITLPDVKINDVNVDIASLDYMFIKKKANDETVSEEAYKACNADVKQESSTEDAIYELARQNAKYVVEALVRPFVEQLDDEYVIEIN